MISAMTSIKRRQLDRVLTLLGAAACAFAALRLRDRYGWQETDAELALIAACAAAGVFAGVVGFASGRRVSAALAFAMVGSALVIALIFVHYVVRMLTTADYS